LPIDLPMTPTGTPSVPAAAPYEPYLDLLEPEQPTQGTKKKKKKKQPATPEEAIPQYRYEDTGLYPETDLPGPGPTESAPEGMEWAVQYYQSPTGGGTWGWTLVEEGAAVDGVAPGSTVSPQAPSGGGPGGGGGGDGGGGGGGAGGGKAPGEAGVEPLGELSWWGADQVPPLLRNWAGWLRELVEINALTSPVPNPFALTDAEAEAAATELEGGTTMPAGKKGKVQVQEGETLASIAAQYGLTLEQLLAANPEISDPSQVVVGQKIVVPNKKDRGAVAATASPSSTAQRLAGYKTTPEIAETLRDLMGIQLEKGQTPTQQWQTVINAIPNAPLRAQQLLSSLQFDAKRGWYTASSRQIVNPAYI